ncbi:MAG: VWA domain-containing protein [Acidobacteriia bacterium]|nr:VWA domain-containing protein [Terriglobia bacterium]
MDTVVTDQDGNLVTGLKRQNFRVLDNGQPQQVTTFAPTEAPITIVILMEFSKIGRGYFGYKAREWSYGFLNQLKPQDWVALKTFDLRTTIRADFTQNKGEVQEAIGSLIFPDFSEANLFDAVYETVDQLRDVPGKKSILIIATGFDTFSKHNLDQILRRLKETDITIFCIGMGAEIDLYGGGRLVPSLPGRNERNLQHRGGLSPQPVLGRIFSVQPPRWQIPQADRAGPRRRRESYGARQQEGEEEKGRGNCPRRLHRTQRRRRRLAQHIGRCAGTCISHEVRAAFKFAPPQSRHSEPIRPGWAKNLSVTPQYSAFPLARSHSKRHFLSFCRRMLRSCTSQQPLVTSSPYRRPRGRTNCSSKSRVRRDRSCRTTPSCSNTFAAT